MNANNVGGVSNENISTPPLSLELKQQISESVKEEIRKEIAIDKASLFTIFGIFASIVVFISVEIQILKTVCDFRQIVGFSLIMLASLTMFVLLLDHIGRAWRHNLKEQFMSFPWIIFGMIVVFFVAGLYYASSGNEQICYENKIYQRYAQDFDDRQIEIEKKLNITMQKKLDKELSVFKKLIISKQQKKVGQHG